VLLLLSRDAITMLRWRATPSQTCDDSVVLSVTFVHCIKMAKSIIMPFPRVANPVIHLIRAKYRGAII